MCDHGRWSSCVRSSGPCGQSSDDARLLSFINHLDDREERREKIRQSERQQQQQPIIVFEGGSKGCGDNPNCKIPNCQVHPNSCMRSFLPDPMSNAFRPYTPSFPSPYGPFGYGFALGARPPWMTPAGCTPFPTPCGLPRPAMMCGPTPPMPMGCPPPLGWCTACGQMYPNNTCGCANSGNTNPQGGSQSVAAIAAPAPVAPAPDERRKSSLGGGAAPVGPRKSFTPGPRKSMAGGPRKSMASVGGGGGQRKSMAPPGGGGQKKSMAPPGGGARKSMAPKSSDGSAA